MTGSIVCSGYAPWPPSPLIFIVKSSAAAKTVFELVSNRPSLTLGAVCIP